MVVLLAAGWGDRADAQDTLRTRADSIAKARADSIAKARTDSLAKARVDSIARARGDSIARPMTDTARAVLPVAGLTPDTVRKNPMLTRADTLRAQADSIRESQMRGLDLVKKKVEVAWAPEDSVMIELLSREGYTVTKYQGTSVRFKATEHEMFLVGKRAAVLRDSSLLVGDTITFNDSTKLIRAAGDTVTLRDPSQGPDDVVALGSIRYDMPNRRGVVRDVTTAVESGQRWIVHGDLAAFKGDTSSAGRAAFYAKDGWLTSCEETEPHYHFVAKEMKLISRNIMIVRPAILYIADIPVAWLPFVFNDMRPGRRSGLLPPQIGFNQVFRNSLRSREISNIGYYFAISDYLSTTLSMDWQSSARTTSNTPGYLRVNSITDYKWKDRFIDGRVGVSMHYLRDGVTNRSYSLDHRQKFSERTNLSANFNYTSNTQVLRQTTFNPQLALQTIDSRMNFSTGRGPFSLSLGASQKQYPGRDQLDRGFPTLSVTSRPIEVGEWLTWTPSFSLTNAQSFDLDQPGDFRYRYVTAPGGGLDSVQIKKDTRNSAISFDTPIEIFGFNWRNAFRVTDVANEFPERRTLYTDPRDTTTREERVFARTFRTGFDWETSFNLPTFSQGKFNIAPTMSIQKVDGRSPLIVRTERTGGKFVAQGLRPSFGISMGPKLYGFFGGFGPVERIRHAIEPSISYSYTPRGNVSDEFLSANGDLAFGFLGNLPQNVVSLGLATSFEAKLRPQALPPRSLPALPDSLADSTGADSLRAGARPAAPEEGRKVKVLSLNFTTLSYDFVRAKESKGGTGLTNRNFDISARSDLLPGFDFGINYSLFQGDPISDTAVFKPYREGVRASMSLDANSPLIRGLGRLLGIRMADSASRARAQRPGGNPAQPAINRASGNPGGNRDFVAGRPIVGSSLTSTMQVPQGQGWRLNVSYTGTRQRPPVGDNVKEFDPVTLCEPYRGDIFQYDACVRNYATGGAPISGLPANETTRGGTLFRVPPQGNINGSMSFHATEKWAAQWQTSYDVRTREFAQHVVSLQRAMHDWDAIFAFTRSTNGNFSFNFFIALRAQPDIKFDYRRPSYPRGYTGRGAGAQR
ncbi:MAG: hypothetical protein IT361_08740 [Gemmatimonadaceae bacterium]|nr:hypothetical protein [Gemmatimonadaceae bacterium]